MNENIKQQKGKILELLYSGNAASDLLAFELIQHIEDNSSFVLPFMGVLFTPTSQRMSIQTLDLLQPFITREQLGYFKKRPNGIKNFYLRESYLAYFTEKELAEIAYMTVRRKGFGIHAFLIFDDGSHPNRSIIFDILLKEKINYNHLIIKGLFPDEMERYIEFIFLRNPSLEFDSLSIEYLKKAHISKQLLKASFEAVEYTDTLIEYLPKELLKLKGVKRLLLKIKKTTKLPNDWEELKNLEELYFGKTSYVFTDFTFLDGLPKLEWLSVDNQYFSHPDILLRKNLPKIHSGHFISSEGFEVNNEGQIVNKKRIFSLAQALGNSSLSLVKQKKFLRKLMNQKMSSLSKEELEELLTANIRRFEKKIKSLLYIK